ncbi:pentapeptide repeat-containing protein [Ralstonia pseudosolanacearum]|uniref:pentapeptide repeat-containing protein n=1 Tax=Ralstonia pseudosolanacearum TaxID=1310165 RepID=UPI001FF84E5B|nr:pentapeptide repeat-containing protein [Ralstonia pseudosolanacearum]
MTHKRRLAITDDDGEHIKAVYVEPDASGFEGADLCGVCAPLIQNLRGVSFRHATLYWANLCGADLSGCDFEGADLSGAALQDARFVGANLRDAKLARDNLGGATKLQGADLTGAQLHGTDLRGAEYDDKTKFPVGFDPTSLYTSQVTPYESRTYKGSSGGIAPSLLHADTPEAFAARGSGRCA